MQAIRRVDLDPNSPEATALTSTVAIVERNAEWRAYDRLGPELRQLLQESPIDIDAGEVLQTVDMFKGWGRRAAEEMALKLYREQTRAWCAAYRESFTVRAAG